MQIESTVECVADVRAVLGEGPVWATAEQALYWLDIEGRKIFRLDRQAERRQWPTPFRVGCIAPRASGGLIAGTDQGIAIIDLESSRFDIVANPEPDRPHNRFNDGKVDRQGRLWAGTMDDTETAASGALYRLDRADRPKRVDDGYKVTNGPCFSPDGRSMYENDSALRVTYAFELAADGTLSNKREFRRYAETDGYPDGMTVDAQGCLWIAFWDGWAVRRYSPDGELLGEIALPVQRPTSCVFAGEELDTVYVTSATIGLDDEALARQPRAGGLFRIDPGVRGLADIPFNG